MIYAEQQYPAAMVNPVYPQQQHPQQPTFAAPTAAPTAAPNVPPAMPAGWAAHWDQGQNKYYYHNTSTDAVTWEFPNHPPLPTPPVSSNGMYVQQQPPLQQQQQQYVQNLDPSHQYQSISPQVNPQQQWQSQQPANQSHTPPSWTNGPYQQLQASYSTLTVSRGPSSVRSSSTPHPIGYTETSGSDIPALTPQPSQKSTVEDGLMLSSECEEPVKLSANFAGFAGEDSIFTDIHISNGLDAPPKSSVRETPNVRRIPTASPPPTLTSHSEVAQVRHPKPQVPPGPMNVPLLHSRSLSMSPVAPTPAPSIPGFGAPTAKIASRKTFPINPPHSGNQSFYAHQGPAFRAGTVNPHQQQQHLQTASMHINYQNMSPVPPRTPQSQGSVGMAPRPGTTTIKMAMRPMPKIAPSTAMSAGANMTVAGLGAMTKAGGTMVKKTLKDSGSFWVPKKKVVTTVVKPVQQQFYQQQQLHPQQQPTLVSGNGGMIGGSGRGMTVIRGNRGNMTTLRGMTRGGRGGGAMQPIAAQGFNSPIPPPQLNQYSTVTSHTAGRGRAGGLVSRGMTPGLGLSGVRPAQRPPQQMAAQQMLIQQQQIAQQNQRGARGRVRGRGRERGRGRGRGQMQQQGQFLQAAAMLQRQQQQQNNAQSQNEQMYSDGSGTGEGGTLYTDETTYSQETYVEGGYAEDPSGYTDAAENPYDGGYADGADQGVDNTGGYADETGGEEMGYEETGYEETGYEETSYEETGYEETGYEETGHEETGYEETGYEETGYEETGYEESGYDTGAYGDSGAYESQDLSNQATQQGIDNSQSYVDGTETEETGYEDPGAYEDTSGYDDTGAYDDYGEADGANYNDVGGDCDAGDGGFSGFDLGGGGDGDGGGLFSSLAGMFDFDS